VWLAQQGREVTAVDGSAVGLGKARQLAEARGVGITTLHADLADFEIEADYWDVIVSIYRPNYGVMCTEAVWRAYVRAVSYCSKRIHRHNWSSRRAGLRRSI